MNDFDADDYRRIKVTHSTGHIVPILHFTASNGLLILSVDKSELLVNLPNMKLLNYLSIPTVSQIQKV